MENYPSEANPEPELIGRENQKSSIKRFVLDLAETILLSALLFLAINALSARVRIESISMQPTLYEGDFVIVNKLAYKLGTPGRADIVVFYYPPDPTREPYIKRVIGLPGESIKIENGQVFVDGNPVREPYIKASPAYQGNWTVPEGNLFVLGDNRNSSSDSHSWGMVPIENIIGKAEVVYFPFSHWQVLNPRIAAAAEPFSNSP
jgi:signal peptidase I